MRYTDREHVLRIEKNDEKAIRELYDIYSDSYMQHFKNFGLNSQELEDTFQDSIIALYQNIVQKRYENNQTASLKSYIWAIGKHKIMDAQRKKKVKLKMNLSIDTADGVIVQESEMNERQQMVQMHFKVLGKKCQELLKLFYYQGMTIKEIVSISNYKDENTVKSSKSRCVKQLRELIERSQ